MSSDVKVKTACRKCGSSLVIEDEGREPRATDKVRCPRCDRVVGTWGEIKSKAVDKVRREALARIKGALH